MGGAGNSNQYTILICHACGGVVFDQCGSRNDVVLNLSVDAVDIFLVDHQAGAGSMLDVN